MESKELNAFKDSKPHNNEDWLRNAYLVEGKEVGEIANELGISTKLVHIKLKEYGLTVRQLYEPLLSLYRDITQNNASSSVYPLRRSKRCISYSCKCSFHNRILL